jgi:hypothetical protein
MKHLLKHAPLSIFFLLLSVSFELQTLTTDKYSPLNEEKFEHGSALTKLIKEIS